MNFAYYASPMDRYYAGNKIKDVNPSANIEEPIMPMKEIGQTITEGRQFGSFIQSAQAAIRAGAGQIELQPGMGGGEEPVGAESYGKEAREALRELARANEIKFSSVHTPVQIGNMSGFNPQQGGFSDEYRDKEVEEVRAAIKFAAETAQGGAIVIHTGEFQRPMFDAPWNRNGMFKAYAEEPERAVKPLVDIRTGRVIQEVRMNQIVPRAVWNRYEEDSELWEKNNGKSYTDDKGNLVKPGDYVDYEGNKLNRTDRIPKYDEQNNTFLIKQERWEDLVKEAEDLNKERAQKAGMSYDQFIMSNRPDVVTPEEAFLYATTETQEAIAKGWASNYAERLRNVFQDLKTMKESRKFYEKLEAQVPEEELWKIIREDPTHTHILGEARHFLPGEERKKPTEIIDRALRDLREEVASIKEMVTGQLQHAEEQKILRDHAQAASKYAVKQTAKSYAEMGIEAMQQSEHNPLAKKNLFLAPENIFPEMGYGSHPEELIELVKTARKEMVKYLTEQYIEDPNGAIDPNTKKPIIVANPNYRGMNKEEAEREAKDHIKATLDTQHLGMWFNNFQPKPGETYQDRKKRFDKWYLQEIENIAKADIVGNIHLVDAIGGSHQHLPAGQGDLPLKDALNILKKNGYKGSINSEAWGEERFGQGRIMLETWREFGSPIYSLGGYGMPGMPSASWGSVMHSYFGKSYPPYFIFGAYSPSNDWTLWSEVPME